MFRRRRWRPKKRIQRLKIWLWTGGGGGPPDEWADLVLCRDIYHCSPGELEDQDYDTAMLHYAMHNAQLEVKAKREAEAYRRASKGKGKG